MKLNIKDTTQILNPNASISGNVKIIVDNNSDIFLQSIDANNILKKNIFKKYAIDEKKGYGYNISNFFNKFAELNNAIFYEKNNIENKSEAYFSEKNRINAVLFLNDIEKIPDFFVILKSKYTKYSDILKNSKIIKTFDIKNTRIGTLLKNTNIPQVVYKKDFFNANRYIINAINLLTGVDVNYNISYDDKNKNEIDIDNDIVNFFKLNTLITSNYFNISFLFDDGELLDNENYYGYFVYNKGEIIVDINTELFNIPEIKDNYFNINSDSLLSKSIPIKKDIILPEEDNTFYSIRDKKNIFYKIKNYDSDLDKINIVLNQLINLSSFYGLIENSNINIPATLLKGKDYSNLKFTINSNKNTIFSNGDFLSVKIGVIDNIEYRVIAANDCCCCSDDYCYEKSIEVNGSAMLVDTEIYAGSTILTFKIPKFTYLEEDRDIVITTNKYKNISVNIDKVKYDYDNNITYFSIVDNNILFDYAKEIKNISFRYNSPSYYYTFFNLNGNSENTLFNIKKAFDKFKNKQFSIIKRDNNLFFMSNVKNNSFAKYKFFYNFTHSNTDISQFALNDIILTGKKYFNINNNLILNRNRNIVEFTGFADCDTEMRFRLDKLYAKNIDLLNSVFETKRGYVELKKYCIDNNTICHSNYLDEINNYTDKTYVYTINSANDELIQNNMFQISCSKKFISKIYKMKTIDIL